MIPITTPNDQTVAEIDIAAIRTDLDVKKALLNRIKVELKEEFFGIDRCIDAIVDSIQTWFLLPQIITRPVICAAWGQTGTGKTALVRSLVSKIGFSNRYVEIQMHGYSNGAADEPTSICQIVQSSSIEEGAPGIIFLDEFQRFRTVDSDGDVKLERYQDVWMLLSDGKFSSDYSFLSKIEQQLAEDDYYEDMKREQDAIEAEEERLEKGERLAETADDLDEIFGRKPFSKKAKRRRRKKGGDPVALGTGSSDAEVVQVKYKRKYVLYPGEAKTLKKLLRLREPLTEIMTWDKARVRTIVSSYLESNQNHAIDYTKCLIFVAGNIDEAFSMSGSVDDCDTNADIFYEHTKKIGPIEIKNALIQRFRPEQIARLGNNHIVYPSLNRDAYERIIRRACQQYADEARKVCGVTFVISEGVYQEIYENSVYPTQGTRPVFTSIHKMFGSPLSDAILWALEIGATKVGIDLSVPESSLVFSAGDRVKKVKIDFDIRTRRNSRTEDFTALVAVHEAGHAILYAELFKTVPMEIAINVASFMGGYNMFKDMTLSKEDVINRIAVSMGGIVAEEIVFGHDMRSTGCASDVKQATALAAQYVRSWGMDAGFAAAVDSEEEGSLLDNRMQETSPIIDNLVSNQKERVQSILTEHRDLLIDMSRHLTKVKKLDALSALEFIGTRIEGMKALDLNTDVNGDYAARLNRGGVKHEVAF